MQAPPAARPREEIHASLLAHLRALVAFDTVSRHSNLALIDYAESCLAQFGVPCTRLTNPEGTKANLIARIGPEAEGGIVLSGHSDVVPVDGQAWETDPFTLTERAGKWYGRGAADMKAWLAAMLAMLPEFTAPKLTRPLYFAFTYDEEVGCLSAPELVKHIVQHLPRPALAIIGEPTGMEVVTAHKGVFSFETVVSGHEAHSSQPMRGVNAVHIACKLVHFLTELAQEYAQSGLQNPRFDPPWSTIHVGVISGGTARNIIPKECRFVWEVRPLPGERAEAVRERFDAFCETLLPAMRAVSPQAGINTAMRSHMHGMQLDAAEMEQRVLACAQTNTTRAVSFGTEAGVFQEHGIPVVVCGPGSIDQAHQPNEFIETAQLEKCVDFMRRLVMMLE